MKGFFIPPNGIPNWENILVVVLLSAAFYYYFSKKKPSSELTYMDFVNNYLTKNQVKMITITEDKHNSMFQYKAEVEMMDGSRMHVVLP